MAKVLGVDGGGTKTHAVVAQESGEVLGVGVGPASNWEDVGLDAAGKALDEAVRASLSASGVGAGDLSASVFGLAGLDWESDVGRLSGIIDPLGLGGQWEIVNDSFVALRAGANHPYGVVVISGGGTVAAGRNPDGEEFRTFGLGPQFGDWGSAAEVAEDALRAISHSFTGRGPKTALAAIACEWGGVSSVPELFERLSRPTRPVHDLAPLVLRAAEDGDAIAKDIVERAGISLGEAAASVAVRLAMDDLPFELVMAGGMFRTGSRLLIAPLEREVKRVAPKASSVRLEVPPVVGAALRAIELLSSEPAAGAHLRLSLEVIKTLHYEFT